MAVRYVCLESRARQPPHLHSLANQATAFRLSNDSLFPLPLTGLPALPRFSFFCYEFYFPSAIPRSARLLLSVCPKHVVQILDLLSCTVDIFHLIQTILFLSSLAGWPDLSKLSRFGVISRIFFLLEPCTPFLSDNNCLFVKRNEQGCNIPESTENLLKSRLVPSPSSFFLPSSHSSTLQVIYLDSFVL
jgi:hypothetical protein